MSENNITRTSNNTEKVLNYILVIAITLSAGTIGIYLYTFSGGLSQDNEKWGAFGSFLGGALGPMLSFLSLIAIIKTIRLQLDELELTKEELRRSADAQTASEKHLRKQAEVLESQQFESSFYTLLAHHNKILEAVTSRKKLESDHHSILDAAMKTLDGGDYVVWRNSFLFKTEFLNVYFNILKTTIEFIVKNDQTNSEIKEDHCTNYDVDMYLNILMSSITSNMIIALMIYSQRSTETAMRLHKLVEDYELIKKSNLTSTNRIRLMIKKFPKNFPQSGDERDI